MTTTEPDDLVNDLFKTADALTSADVSDGTMSELAQRLATLHGTINLLKEIADTITASVASDMEADKVTIPGVGILNRRPRYSSTWVDDGARERMYDDAVAAMIRQIAVDPMTGEVHPPLANAVRAVWAMTMEAFSLGADPKVAFKKKLGLQPDTYRNKYVTGYTVTIGEETL